MRHERALRAAALLLLSAAPARAQQTRPERTAGAETSTYADVVAFIDSLATRSAAIRIGTLGTSPEGRRLPYVIAARPMVDSPGDAARTGKPII